MLTYRQALTNAALALTDATAHVKSIDNITLSQGENGTVLVRITRGSDAGRVGGVVDTYTYDASETTGIRWTRREEVK